MKSRFVSGFLLWFAVISNWAIASTSEGFEVVCNNFGVTVFYNSVVSYPSAQDVVIRNPSMLLYDLIQISLDNCSFNSGERKQYVFDYEASDDNEYLQLKLENDEGQTTLYDDLASNNLRNQILDLLSGQGVLIPQKIPEKPIWVSSNLNKCEGRKFTFGAFPSDQARRYCFIDSEKKGFIKVSRRGIKKVIGAQ